MTRAAFAALPSRLTLPSGLLVGLRGSKPDGAAPLARRPAAPLFAEVLAAFDADLVRLTKGAAPVDVRTLVLRDFHVLRAVLARSGIVDEEEVEISCRNCGAVLRVRPCGALEIGPWVDGELDDPELDATLPFGEPIDVPPVPLGRVRTARSVTLEERTVEGATALFAAAAKQPLDLTGPVVTAMGIVALGAETSATKIADALAACDDAAFHAICDAFVETHYPARLGCAVFCEACGARNDVDAPFERELGFGAPANANADVSQDDDDFPEFETFSARAREIARGLLHDVPGEPVELVIEGATPAVDEGGEPLLGSYVPADPGDASAPSRSPVVTIYYRTFEAMWNEEGRYDWNDELAETIEHELEHHAAFLSGDDPMDDEERATIRDEAVRIIGRREAERRALTGFGASLQDFARRTWPLWLLALVALVAMLATQR